VTKDRVLITGAGRKGMLGNAVFPYFVRPLRRPVRDRPGRQREHGSSISSPRHRRAAAGSSARCSPRWCCTLAALTDLEFCEDEPGCSGRHQPHGQRGEIATLCEQYGATLGTSARPGCLDGTKEGFYTEADLPQPLMVYGQTKFDGENSSRRAAGSTTRCARAGWSAAA